MKYLKKFATEAEAEMFDMPNVVLAEDTGNVLYNVRPKGVFIQHIDGSLYTTDQWTAGGFTSDQANGVAVCDINASFVIAKTSLGASTWSSDIDNAVEGVMLTNSVTTAITDYAGEANTTSIAAIDTSGATYKCDNFVFPNGAKGYLPALGEWQIAHNNRAAVNAALSLIGGSSLGSQYYWSSTQYSANRAWVLLWGNAEKYGNYKDSTNNLVRAFSAL